jgi:transposase
MDRQTLRDWVHRYNAEGIAGLSDARRSGRPPALSQAQMEELKELVLAGPDLAKNGVVRWRCTDLRLDHRAHRGQAAAAPRTDAVAAATLPSEEGRRGAGGF